MSGRGAWGTTAALVVAGSVVLGLLVGTVRGAGSPAPSPPPAKPALIHVTAHRLALFGDSLLDPLTPSSPSVAAVLAADLPTVRIADLCLPESATAVVQRTKQALDARPDLLVVAIGSVDGYQSLPIDEFTTAAHTLMASVVLPPTRMLVVIPPPPLYQSDAQLSFFKQYTDVVRAEARAHSAAMVDITGSITGADYTADGLSLSDAGARRLATAIEAQL